MFSPSSMCFTRSILVDMYLATPLYQAFSSIRERGYYVLCSKACCSFLLLKLHHLKRCRIRTPTVHSSPSRDIFLEFQPLPEGFRPKHQVFQSTEDSWTSLPNLSYLILYELHQQHRSYLLLDLLLRLQPIPFGPSLVRTVAAANSSTSSSNINCPPSAETNPNCAP